MPVPPPPGSKDVGASGSDVGVVIVVLICVPFGPPTGNVLFPIIVWDVPFPLDPPPDGAPVGDAVMRTGTLIDVNKRWPDVKMSVWTTWYDVDTPPAPPPDCDPPPLLLPPPLVDDCAKAAVASRSVEKRGNERILYIKVIRELSAESPQSLRNVSVAIIRHLLTVHDDEKEKVSCNVKAKNRSGLFGTCISLDFLKTNQGFRIHPLEVVLVV